MAHKTTLFFSVNSKLSLADHQQNIMNSGGFIDKINRSENIHDYHNAISITADCYTDFILAFMKTDSYLESTLGKHLEKEE